MRVITGSLRGRKLKSPKGDDIRPTTDKVKEAIFDIIYQYVPEDYIAVDVFAGSGSIGIEAISRGASKVFFSDQSRESLALVRDNLNICGITDQAILLNGDFKRNIARVKDCVDVYFLDPPYADGFILPALKSIDQANVISDDGIVVAEHSAKEKLPERISGFTRIKERKYGTIAITIYQRGDREIGE